MAVNTSLTEGNGESTIKRVTQSNFDDIVAQDAALTDVLDETLLSNVGGKGQTEFREVVNANVAVCDTAFSSAVGSSYSLNEGDSWVTMRGKLNSIMTALEAAIPVV